MPGPWSRIMGVGRGPGAANFFSAGVKKFVAFWAWIG